MPVDLLELKRRFAELYGGSQKPRLFRAPGRVNLIGEHTDYNDGFVLPMAIERETTLAATTRNDDQVSAFSVDRNEAIEFRLDNFSGGRSQTWRDYVEGTAHGLVAKGARLRGANLLIASDIPAGAGLSSSAALEVAVGSALIALAKANATPLDIALAGQWAEHNYVGTNSGIMDQFVSALGKKGHALLIDCRSLESQPVPLKFGDYELAICDTNVKHELASSEYNTRRSECEQGVEVLQKYLPEIKSLRGVSVLDFVKHEHYLPPVIRKRCRHVVGENARTLSFVRAVETGGIAQAGELMRLSHESLREDYAVSCRELDALVEIAGRIKGVAGARMTGGGFGGCTVNLVEKRAIENFSETIRREYKNAVGIEPQIYFSAAADGAREIKRFD